METNKANWKSVSIGMVLEKVTPIEVCEGFSFVKSTLIKFLKQEQMNFPMPFCAVMNDTNGFPLLKNSQELEIWTADLVEWLGTLKSANAYEAIKELENKNLPFQMKCPLCGKIFENREPAVLMEIDNGTKVAICEKCAIVKSSVIKIGDKVFKKQSQGDL